MRLRALVPLLVVVAACRTSAPPRHRPPRDRRRRAGRPLQSPPAAPLPRLRRLRPQCSRRRPRPSRVDPLGETIREHRALFLQVYGMATQRWRQEAAQRSPGSWAVVLDADETVIDNSLYQLERARLALPSMPRAGAPGPRAARPCRFPARRPFSPACASWEAGSPSSPTARRTSARHRDRLPGERTRLRRHAVQAGPRPRRQEPALRGGGRRHDTGRPAPARDRGRRRRTTSSTSRD